MLYCLTRSEWISIGGIIVTLIAIGAAFIIAFSQERKNRKRIEEENKNIEEMICALIVQTKTLSTKQDKSYQDSIDQLEKNSVSIPVMKLVPMTGIKKLEQFNPDILYRVFKKFKLTGKDYSDFILRIDRISSGIEIGMRNYEKFMYEAVRYTTDFQLSNKEFKKMIYSFLRLYEKEKKTSDPIYTGIVKIIQTFNASEESKDNGNIRHIKNELVDKIKEKIKDQVQNNEDLKNVFCMIGNLETAYMTIQNSNKKYVKSLQKAKENIVKDMQVIMQIYDKLEKQCK